jgi:hypothetical protein
VQTETVNTTANTTQAATCTAAGKTTYTATFTNSAFTTQTKANVAYPPAAGHTWSTTPKAAHKISDATCTAPATYHKYCSVCDAEHPTDTFTSGTELGHDFGTGTTRVHNRGDGTHDWKCSRCDAYGKVDNGTQVENGYVSCDDTYGNWSTNTATCTAGGSHYRDCSVCGYRQTEATSQLGHNWVEDTGATHLKSAATCEDDAIYYKSCSRCGVNDSATFVDVGSKTGHNFGGTPISIDDTNHWYLCQNGCGSHGAVIGGAQTVNGTEAHVWGENDPVEVNPATCGEDGLKKWTCTLCSHEKTAPIPATGLHDWELVNHQAATCAAPGLDSYKCKNCEATYTDVLPVDGSNHTNLQRTAPVSNSCEGDGNIEYWYCSGCGKYYRDAAATDEISQADTVIPAHGHDFSADPTRVNNLGNGTHNWACAYNCGASGKVDNGTQVKNGYVSCDATYGDWSTDTATCTAGGSHYRDCSVCGYRQTEATSQLGHKWVQTPSAAHKISDADCEHAAVYHVWCERCGIDHATDTFTYGSQLGHDYTGAINNLNNGTHNWACKNDCGTFGIVENGTQVKNGTVECDFDEFTPNTATCENPGEHSHTCRDCGYTETLPTDPLGHHWVQTVDASHRISPADCEHAAVYHVWCDRCGENHPTNTFTDGNPLGHDFTGAVRDNGNGTHEYMCQNGCGTYGGMESCSDYYSDWGNNAADCTNGGTETRTCSKCSHVDSRPTAALGHDFSVADPTDENALFEAATCTDPAKYFYKCSRCGEIDENASKYFEFGDPLDHDWTGTPKYVWTTGNHSMIATLYCKNDKNHTCQETVNAVETVSKAPTCVEKGESTFTATFTNLPSNNDYGVTTPFQTQTTTAETAMIPHNYEGHEAVAPTCSAAGNIEYWTCDMCNQYFKRGTGATEMDVITQAQTILPIDPDAHAWGEWTETTEPTCTGEGVETRVCANDPSHTETRPVTATGHLLVEVPAVAATCVTSGNIQYWKCAYCDAYFEDAEGTTEITDKTSVVVQGGHQFPLIHHAATAATCVTAGNIEYYECEVCGKYFSDAAGTQQITNKNDVIIQPSGHDWNPETITYVWSDDYSKVTATMKCRNDESHVMVRVSNTTAEATNANCTTPGTTTYTAVFTEPFATQTKAVNNIASLGHMLIKTPAKAATCMETGNIEYWTCSRCRKVFTDGTAQSEITDLSTLTIPKAPNNHAVLTHVPEAPATCTNDGTAEHWVCNACGHLFVYENNVLTEKTMAQLKIDAHHTLTTHVTAKAPTCLAEGNVEYWRCSACDKLFAADKSTELPTAVLSATGHSFSTVAAVEATCEEAGHEAYKKCNNCGLFFDTAATVTTTADNAIDPSDMVTDPIGHDYSARPTFVWNGHTAKATFVCQNDSSHTEEVDCVITETALSPVCETAGSVVYTAHAVLDGHEWTEDSDPEEIAATGHKFVGEVRDNDDGTHSFKCVYCDKYGTGEGSTAVVDGSEAHNFPADGWKIGENESCLTAGTESNYCTVCGHKETRTLLATVHDFEAVPAKPATCTEDGNIAYYICNACGEFFSSNEHPTSDADKIADQNSVVISATGHDWKVTKPFAWVGNDNDGYTAATASFTCENDNAHTTTVVCTISVNKTDADCVNGGSIVYTATAVLEGETYTDTKTVTLGANGHDWGTPTYSWSDDRSTCTATVICNDNAEHTLTEVANADESISIQPTCTEEGLAVYTATFENPLFTQQKEYKTLLATGHPDESVHKYEQAPTCTEDGYEAYWKCDICGKMYDSATLDHEIVAPTSSPASGHAWGTPTYTWAEDNSSVTATRICGNDGSHVETVTVNTTSAVTTPATCEGKGKTTYTATFTTPFATQTKVVENVDALGHDFSPSKDRVHDLDGDNSHHNYACANGCGAYGVGIGNAATVGGVVECAFGDWIISNNESCTEAGSEWRQCAYCSNKETHPRAALPHTEVEVEAKDATCIADGNKAYTYCSVCGTILSVGGTPETSGVKVYDAAGKELIKTTTKLGHDLTKTDAVAPTCEIAGNIDYWTCSRCGKIFNVEEPAEDTDPITLADIVDPAIGHDYSAAADRIHSLNNGTHNWACANGCGTYGVMENSIPVKNGTVACTGDPATCTQDAHCTVCGGVFASALGHDYRLQSWTWNGVEAATANFVCSRDSSHTHQETAVITTEPATVTCTEPGKMVYFATVHFENGIYTDKKSVIVPALGHDWDFEHPVYDWDQTKQQCTVTLKCLNDGCTAEYTEIGYNETQTTAATCENAGSVVYTAHFNISEALVSPSITVTLEALGHKWGDPDWHWAEDFSSATVTLTCGRAGCGKVETVNATVTPDTVAPTCEKDGRTVYTATATLDGRTYKDTKLTTQPASGHAWPDQPAFSWTGSDAAGWTAATATFACANNAEHDQTLTCAVTHVTEDPTCEGSGKTTYTATVTFNGNTYIDQKEVTINPTGHSYEFVDFNWSYNESTKVWSATVANFKCANDPTHTATAEATVTSETVEAICEADGSITYTATATFEGNTYTDEKVVVLPMLHHNWGDATYTWVKDGDQYKVTALRVCANKPTEHQQTETVTTTSEITASSGCESQGTLVYTAVFHTPFATQTKEEAIAVTGHTLVHTAYQDSTCTEVGNIEYWRCSVCNKIFTDELASTTSYIGTDLAATVISAKGHDFVMSGDGMVAIDNEDGTTHSFKCSRCDVYGAVIDGEQTVDGKVAHVYGEWKITKESTCTDQGDKEHVCKVCGHIETAKADLKPHEIYGISAVAPTCTVAGNIAYYYCAVCRRYFSDEAGTTVIALSETVLPALGHDFTGAVRDNGDGTHSFKCSRCGTYGAVIDGVQKPLAAGGKVAHTFDQEKQSREYVHNYANCYEPLTYYKSCVCGAKGTDTFTPEGATALGHDWLEFPEQKATCTQAGHSMYWECQRCHKQGGPENAHPYVLYPATTHGAYNIVENGASADGLIKWEACFCENKCGDYYMMNVIITSVDANGTRVPNVNVRVVNSAGKTIASGTTDGNGEVTFAKVWEDRIHPGTYDIYLEYVRDGSNYNTHGTVNFADGKVTGSFGKLTPYGGNASGSIGGKPTGEFRCSMCDLNDSMKNKPVIGWFISIIHAFVHAISRIGRR